jgi:hypothetical protein
LVVVAAAAVAETEAATAEVETVLEKVLKKGRMRLDSVLCLVGR